MAESLAVGLAWVQGLFWFLTGVWPLLHMPSFLAVTGPKKDLWLVHTVGLLIALVGAVLLVAAARHTVTFEVGLLGAAGALGLAAVDVVYVLDGTILPIYLLDALPELMLVAGWVAAGLLARG